jgi:ParB-like chromosome segregation protein Spo0J
MMMPTTNKYQVMPPLADDEYMALMEDIRENGVQVPVVKDENGDIIDGYHRVRAWEHLKVFDQGLPPYPTIIRSDLKTDDEKRELAWRLNMQRRHLNQVQKRDAIAAKLKESPHWADNRLANLLGVDHKTVRSVRNSLERSEELPKHEMLQGADKKYYPRERPGETKLEKFRRTVAAGLEQAREKQVADERKDLDDEEMAAEFLETASTEVYGSPTQTHARAVREKMRELTDLVTGYEDQIKSEDDREAYAEAVVELLSYWIERFEPLLDANLKEVRRRRD